MFEKYEKYTLYYYQNTEFKLITLLFVFYYFLTILYLLSGYPIEFLIISSILFLLIMGFSKNDIILFLIIILSWIVLKFNFNESISFLLNY